MRVICYDCEGTGELGHTNDGRLIACETCGGHEDALGTGYLGARCMACPDKDANYARLRAALEAERMVRNARATPDPGEALIRSFVALVEERDTLRSELDAANAENARLLRLGRVAGELRDCLVDAHFGELWTDGMVDEGYIKPLRIARAEAALAAYDAALKGDPDD